MRKTQLILALAAIGFAGSALATNGMNLEGYGPIASGMGGASQAYDNGTAAVMNNPATLGLAADGSRLDIALGMLGPDAKANCVAGPCAGASSNSGGDAYYMPAIGWAKKSGALTYGLAMFAQGGMGTEYDAMSYLGAGSGLPSRSELGVGRLIAPLAYQVNPDLVIGGSLDFVWAMLDLKMAIPGGAGYMAAPGAGSLITGGTGVLGGAATAGAFDAQSWVHISFSDNSDFTGKAKGTGWAGKLGFAYKVNPTVTVGGSYHSKTSLGDLKTNAGGAVMTVSAAPLSGAGQITVHDFQWPETYGLGVAVQATPSLMVAADVKRIGWADVMKSFKMTYTATSGHSGMTGSVDFALPQNWDDQTVYQIGMSYKLSDPITLRAGYNYAKNPIPDAMLNALFPAIMTTHYTAGIGWAPTKVDAVNLGLIYAPAEKGGPSAGGTTASLGGFSWQLMYSKQF